MGACARDYLEEHGAGLEATTSRIQFLDLAKDASRQAAAKLRGLRVGKQEQAQEAYQKAQDEVRVQEKIYARTEPAALPAGRKVLELRVDARQVSRETFTVQQPTKVDSLHFCPPRQIARTNREPGEHPST